MRIASQINKILILALLSLGGLTACGGGASTESQQAGGGQTTSDFLSGATADQLAYYENVWKNLSSKSRCGQCHNSEVGQEPVFVNELSIQQAREAVTAYVDFTDVAGGSISNSIIVQKIRGGHKAQACWQGTEPECADDIESFLTAWNAATSGTTAEPEGVKLVAPSPLRSVGDTKRFPATTDDFTAQLYPLLRDNCSTCHDFPVANGADGSFASSDLSQAYLEAQKKVDLSNPENSRMVYRLRTQSHQCWDNPDTTEVALDCVYSSQKLQDAIAYMSDQIKPTVIDKNLIISKAMQLKVPEAIIASGGERHTSNQIALWEFKNAGDDPNATTAYDSSRVEPLMNLTLQGDYRWVGGYGVEFNSGAGITPAVPGRAQASFLTSQKLLNEFKLRSEYTVEAWIIPADEVQEDKNIISYADKDAQNFTIEQYNNEYRFHNYANTTDSTRTTFLETAGDDLKSSQQHIVMTFDKVNGRRIYVNGKYTEDADANNGTNGDFDIWDDKLNFTLANEAGVFDKTRAWKGIFRMVAVHNRVLSDEQITQNYTAGVGEKFFLLFGISHIEGVPADSFIKVQAEQMDSYGYLFSNPVYVNLGSTVPTTINIPIAGMRIGINGKEALIGQSFINLSIDTITANDQKISRLGTVIEVQEGTDIDDFFLSFEKLGAKENEFVVVTPDLPTTFSDLDPVSDIGVRTFSEINATMSELTGVPTSRVYDTYNILIQQLPSTENIDAFVPANIIGISQLAFEYCGHLVEEDPLDLIMTKCERTNNSNETVRDCMFGVGVDKFNFEAATSAAFDSAGRIKIVDALYNRMVGIPSTATDDILENAPTKVQVSGELITNAVNGGTGYPGNLVDRLIGACGTGTYTCGVGQAGTKEIVKAMCTTVLGSAAMLVQ